MATDFPLGVDIPLSQSSQGSAIDEAEMERMEKEAVPTTTSKATKAGVKKFMEWAKKRNVNVDFHTITASDLALILRRFYAEVKKEDGKPLTPSSLVGLRASLNRYVCGAPFYRTINIVGGVEFAVANKMFATKCKLYYKGNNPKPKHKPCIEQADMVKLGDYFSTYHQNPVVLSEAVWFLLCFHFGRRGREGWAEMKKDFFTISEDAEGEYVETTKTETAKNIQGGHRQTDQDYSENRMTGQAVEIFKFFLLKLNPECDRMFQYPVNAFNILSTVWYSAKPIGKNTLSNMMQRISEKANLSKRYTCHSVRASSITTLYQAGVSVDKIIAITRHKNTSSLKHYVSGLSTKQKQECSTILSSSVFRGKAVQQNESSSNSEKSITVARKTDTNSSETVLDLSSLSVGSSASGASGSTKYAEMFGNCTFENCEIRFM